MIKKSLTRPPAVNGYENPNPCRIMKRREDAMLVTLHSSARGYVNHRGLTPFFAANCFSGSFSASCRETCT